MEKIIITAGGKNFPFTGEHTKEIMNSDELQFYIWLEEVFPECKIIGIREEWTYAYDDTGFKYAIFKIEYEDKAGVLRSRIMFFPRNAVAILIVLRGKETGKRYIVAVNQLRVPAGKMLLEIPAGTIEDNLKIIEETAIREIMEETALSARKEDLLPLGEFYVSPGISSEKMTLFACEYEFLAKDIQKLQGKLAGLHEEGEYIETVLIPFEEFPNRIADLKSAAAYYRYKDLKNI